MCTPVFSDTMGKFVLLCLSLLLPCAVGRISDNEIRLVLDSDKVLAFLLRSFIPLDFLINRVKSLPSFLLHIMFHCGQ